MTIPENTIRTFEEGRALYLQRNRRFPLWFAKVGAGQEPEADSEPQTTRRRMIITLGHLQDLPPEGREELFRLHGPGKPDDLRELVIAWLELIWREGEEDPKTMPPPLLDLIANGTYALQRTKLLSVLSGNDFWLPERYHPQHPEPDPQEEEPASPKGEMVVKKVWKVHRRP